MRLRIDAVEDGGTLLVVSPTHDGDAMPDFDGRTMRLDSPTYAGPDRMRGRLVTREGRRCIVLASPFEEPGEYVELVDERQD